MHSLNDNTMPHDKVSSPKELQVWTTKKFTNLSIHI